MNRRDWTALLTLAAIWGASYMFIKIGVRDLSPAVVVFLRVALGALVLVPLAARRTGGFAGVRGMLAPLALLALVQVAGPFMLINEGEQEISSALAGILIASTPIFGALLAVFFDHTERSDGIRGAGVVTGMAGVVLLLGVDLGGGGSELLGGLALLGAGLGYAIGGFMTKRSLARLDPVGIAAMLMVFSSVMSLPPALATLPDSAPGAGPLAAVAVLGLLGTGVAFAIYFDLLQRVGPSKAFIVTYLAPGFAVVYGSLLLDESLSVATFAGLGLILAGSWLSVEGRLPWSRRPARAVDSPAESPA